jgi:hypothetical protein
MVISQVWMQAWEPNDHRGTLVLLAAVCVQEELVVVQAAPTAFLGVIIL